jgi:hypothetical protein
LSSVSSTQRMVGFVMLAPFFYCERDCKLICVSAYHYLYKGDKQDEERRTGSLCT